MKHRFTTFIILITMSFPVFADEPVNPGLWARVQDSLSQTWESKNYEVYIPIDTWHNRNYYMAERIDGFNESPWGLGWENIDSMMTAIGMPYIQWPFRSLIMM